MDPDPPSSTPRKVKFAPKGPPRKPAESAVAKIEAAPAEDDEDNDSEAQQQALSRKVNEHLTRRGTKLEKKSSVQVAFSHGVTSNSIRSFGKQKERSNDQTRSDADDLEGSALDYRQKIGTSTSTAGTEIVEDSDSSSDDDLILKKRKEYTEPWDYDQSYYPTTVPLRRPFSGDPELLDKDEFENPIEYDENTLNSASDLGLLDNDDAHKMIFFQFPTDLPLGRRPTSKSATNPKEVVQSSLPSAASKGKEVAGSILKVSGVSTGTKGKEIAGNEHPSKEVRSLEQLPKGYMGKMLVYKSGAVKLKLGDILYDVSYGSECVSAQSVVAINTINTHCCNLGELTKRAVVNPDTDFMVDHVINLE